jgi:hypothetical protein
MQQISIVEKQNVENCLTTHATYLNNAGDNNKEEHLNVRKSHQ